MRQVGWAISLGALALPNCALARAFTVVDDSSSSRFCSQGSGGPITFSPDRKLFIICSERGLVDSNRAESRLALFRMEDISKIVANANVNERPEPRWTIQRSTYRDGPIITDLRWLANSRSFAFLAKTASGNKQLVLADASTGVVRAVSPEEQHVTAFDVRDENHFVYAALNPAIARQASADLRASTVVGTNASFIRLMVPDTLNPFQWDGWYDQSELWADTGTGTHRVIDAHGNPVHVFSEGQQSLSLAPNGRSAVTVTALADVPMSWAREYTPVLPFFEFRGGEQDLRSFRGQHYVGEYTLVDLVDGTTASLTDAPTGKAGGWWDTARPDWSADGEEIALPNTYVRMAPGDSKAQFHQPCLAVVHLAFHSTDCVYRPDEQDRPKAVGIIIDSVSFVSGEKNRVRVNYSGADGQPISRTFQRDSRGQWKATKNGSTINRRNASVRVFVSQSLNEPPVLAVTDLRTRQTRVISDPNPQFKAIEFAKVSLIQWQDSKERKHIGGLFLPVGDIGGRPYPLIIQTHGFSTTEFYPEGNEYPTSFAAQELAASGMMVLQTQDCPISVDSDEAACNVESYKAAIEQLARQGLADPSRVGLVGFSRTSYYVVSALTTYPLSFAAALIADGVNTSYVLDMFDVDNGARSIASEDAAMIGAQPIGAGLQRWLDHSPLFGMDSVRTPLEIQVVSGRIGLPGVWEAYATLRYQHKPVDLIMFPMGHHVLTNPVEQIASRQYSVDWFRFWLDGYERKEPVPGTAEVAQSLSEQYRRWEKLCDLQVAKNPSRPAFCVRANAH